MSLAKILVVTHEPVPAPDGKSVRLQALLRALSGRFDVDVLTPKAGDLPHLELIAAARALRVPSGRGNLHDQIEAFARAVRRQLESDEYRLVHLCDPRFVGPIRELADERGFKLVYEPLGILELDLARWHPRVGSNTQLAERLRAAERLCLGAADAVVVGTRQARRHVVAQEQHVDRISVVPGAVDVAAFDLAGPPPEPPVVGYVGELAPWQGVGTFLRAAKEIHQSRAEARFRLTGPLPPDLAEPLERLVADLGLSEVVEICAPIAHEEVPARLAEATVCVVPTEADERSRAFGPFAVKVAEVMAVGRALVLSRLPAHVELVVDGKEGWFFQAGDHAELAGRVIRLLDDPDEATALGRRAHEKIVRHASLARFRQRLLALYTEVLGDDS